MPTRKFSEETVTYTVQDTDLLALTRDPAGTPVSRVVPAATVRSYVAGSFAPLVNLPAADVGAYTLLNGGSVGVATVTSVTGSAIGDVEDSLLVTITNPTPGIGPLFIAFPITLSAPLPANARFTLSTLPMTVPQDLSVGVIFLSDNSTSLALYCERDSAPPGTYSVKLTEYDALSTDPASWTSVTIPYAGGELLDVTLRKVTPFVAVPQVVFDIQCCSYNATLSYQRVLFSPASATTGTLNDSGAWTGATLPDMSLFFRIDAAYVGTITYTIQLAKNF